MTTILTIDNNQILDTFRSYLQSHGYTVFCSQTAERGLEILDNSPVSIVICDIYLPGMSGFEFIESVVRKYNLEIITITGYAETNNFIKSIEYGASDFMAKPVDMKELLCRIRKAELVHDLKVKNAKYLQILKTLAITDELTNLYNYRKFIDDLNDECARSTRYNISLSLIYFDIDDFKIFNDTYGHQLGDKVLQEISKVIHKNLRKQDTGYRYGGEEFAIILPETNTQNAAIVASRIMADIKLITIGDKTYNIAISVGITKFISSMETQEFIKRGDEAMYVSKRNGKNQITIL